MDGYPRTLAQAASFDQVLRQQFLSLSAVVLFVVDDEEIVQRMSGRWSCPNCKSTYHMVNNPPKVAGICDDCGTKLIQRADDQEETVRERLRSLSCEHGSVDPVLPRAGFAPRSPWRGRDRRDLRRPSFTS